MLRVMATGPQQEALTDAQSHAWFGLLETHALVVGQVERALVRGHDLTFSGYELLYRLSGVEAPVPLRDLAADVVSVSRSRISRVLEDLARAGLVTKSSSPVDARLALVAITDEGRATSTAACETFGAAVRRAFLDALAPDDVLALNAVWSKVPGATCNPTSTG